MIDLEKTKREIEMEHRMMNEKKSWKAIVTNGGCSELGAVSIETTFTSEKDTLDNVLHKVKLDLMTNLHLGFVGPITIKVYEVEI